MKLYYLGSRDDYIATMRAGGDVPLTSEHQPGPDVIVVEIPDDLVEDYAQGPEEPGRYTVPVSAIVEHNPNPRRV